MTKVFRKKVLAAVLAGLSLPLAANAATPAPSPVDAELMKKIEALSREVEALRAQVKANEAKTAQTEEQLKAVAAKTDTSGLDDLKGQVKLMQDKSISKWLTIGGDYRFRADRLYGQSKAFTDISGTFANAQNLIQMDALARGAAAVSTYFGPLTTGQTLTTLAAFQTGMGGVSTYADAKAFLAGSSNGVPNANLIAGLSSAAFAKQVPAYQPANNSLWTNRFGLDLSAKALENVSVNARLLMYKTFGAQDDSAATNGGNVPFFADRVGVFDGTLGHVPSNSYLNVDRAYATISNILDQEMWFSVGRRPTTNSAPNNLRSNGPRPGNGGVPSILVDYAFDGMSFGYAPDIDALPGAYAKLCYGRGFESGFQNPIGNSVKDTDMVGISVVAIDTDPLRVWLQYNKGMNIFDAPVMNNTNFGNTKPKTNLGDIDWWGAGVMSTIKKVGSGDLNFFADFATSITHPNNNVSSQFGFQGLLTGGFFQPEAPTVKHGNAVWLGMRYDLPSKTKFGLEYNHGSKNWITFAPAADDPWTGKIGTRGNVYEAYMIQELDRAPISSFFSKAFFKIGLQRYNFKYTGSNNWVGAPIAIGDVTANTPLTTTPLEHATDAYATFEVKF